MIPGPLTCSCCGDRHMDVAEYTEMEGRPVLCVVCAPCDVCGESGGDCYWDGLRDVCVNRGRDQHPITPGP